jgi:hypothetical protein
MKTKHVFREFFGVIAFVALLMFAVSACDDGPDSGKTGNDPKLPTDLQNTEWVHTDGDRVEFGTKNTVTVIPASGAEKTFTLKDSVTVSELSQTTLYFGDSQISDFILCRDGTISFVNLGGVNKSGDWRLYSNKENWTAVTNSPFGSSDSFASIAYGGGKWLAACTYKMAYSADGITWTKVTDSTFGDSGILAVAYGAGKWVAVGYDEKTAYSADGGVTWTAGNPTTLGDYGVRKVAYGGDRWVAVGDGGVAYSTDGVTWTKVTGYSENFRHVAYGGGKWVAVLTAGRIWYSADGATWTAVTDSPFDNTISISPVAYGNGKWVAVGGSGKMMAYSADGVTWTAVTNNINNIFDSHISGIAYGGGKWVAVGGYDYGKMAYSADGVTWTAVTNSTFDYPYSQISGIAYGGGKWVAVGNGGKMAYSADE